MSPNAGGGVRGLSQWVQLYTGAQINGDLTPYLTYGVVYPYHLDADPHPAFLC